jgi:pimeloyl-ACP methyl ester carboxylesterase
MDQMSSQALDASALLTPKMFDVPVADRGVVRAYACGPTDAPVVVGIHGTPGTGVNELVKYIGTGAVFCRFVTFDRPGYGGSSNVSEAHVREIADVVEAVLDHLSIDAAGVYGISGGGPHALATGALLPDRISRVASCAGIGPSQAPGFDYTTDQIPVMRDEMLAAREGPDASRHFVEGLIAAAGEGGDTFGDAYSSNDRRVAREFRPDVEAVVRAQLGVPAPEPADWVDGYVQDFQAFAATWGFDLASIRIPTKFFHGLADIMCPLNHSQWLRTQVVGAELETFRHVGHSIDQLMPHVYAWLIADLT